MLIWKDNIASKLQLKQMLVLLWKDWTAAFSSGFISISSGFLPEFLERRRQLSTELKSQFDTWPAFLFSNST